MKFLDNKNTNTLPGSISNMKIIESRTNKVKHQQAINKINVVSFSE